MWLITAQFVVAQETIYVGPTRAYTTIQDAADHAIANKELDIATIINIDPGTYREYVDINTYTNWPSNDPDNNTPITFVGPGAVISGSDIFDQWVNTQGNRYEHVWLNDWGVGPDPTNGVNNVADIVRRRELVYVDGQRMTQVLTIGELGNNTFFVDEANDVIVLQTNLNVPNLTVEVGVRDRLYKQEWESNVTLDGLTFVHAATEWNDVDSAVKFNGAANATVINCVLEENNSRGILFTSVKGVYIENTTMNDNGWNGWATWRVTDFVARNSETSRNNWRGHLGAFYTWNVGNKLLATHGIEIRNHLAVDNFSRGLWLDLDNENVLMDSVIVSGNLSDGMFIEANQGPITIINSEFNNNGGEALLVANSDSVTLRDNEFRGNAKNWFRFTGSAGGRGVTNFETKERHTMFTENWVIRNNLIEVTDPSYSIFFNQILGSAFDRFVMSLDADSNTYIHTGRTDAFHDRSNSNLTFDQWKAFSNVDSHSTFTTHPYGMPTARFSFGLENLVAQFDASLSTDDGPLQYAWDFGDGQSDTGPSPSHAFASEGSYTVLLTVTDTATQVDTVSQVINISLTEPPVASFSADITYLSAHLDGSASTDNNFVAGYEWFFGDDSTGVGAVIDHVYADSGNYAVKLVVTDNVGLTDTLIQVIRADHNPPPTAGFGYVVDDFSVSFDAGSSADDGTIQSYLWSFGDDSTGTGVTTAHVYDTTGTYEVELVVIDDGGLTDTLRQDVVIVQPNIPPTAFFVFTVDSVTVSLDASASTDEGSIVSYLWSFGDDSTGTGMTTAHAYDTTGTYQVELVVIDDGGLTDTLRQDVAIVPSNIAPTASFVFTVDSLTVSLDASASTDEGSIVSYLWSFGDDSTGTGMTTAHAYDTTGTYQVELVVIDDGGLTDTLRQDVAIVLPNIAPTASFVFTVDSMTVSLDASASTDDGSIVSYLWSFGDDSTGTGVTTVHTYDTTGTYQVALVVIDDGGLTDTLRQDVAIVPSNIAPTASFVFTVDSLTVSLDASASTDEGSIVSFLWSFGDDSTGTGMTTAHAYDTTGTYQVELVVIDDGGLTDTLSQVVDVVAPQAEFTVKAFLTGPYVGAGQMSGYLAEAGIVPLTQPYADTSLVGSSKQYSGTETVTVLPYLDVVDWVLVELRADTSATSIVARRAVFLRANGDLVDLDGGAVTIPWISDGDFYFVLIHRNHVSVMSAATVTVSAGLAVYDFTSGAGQAYGVDSQLEIEPGVFAICSGDADGDDLVGANDQVLWLQENGQSGYFNSDYNLSGGVTAQDNTILALFSGHSTRVPE